MRPTTIQVNWVTSGRTKVPTTASTMPISPARTPRRAVVGAVIHLIAKMNDSPAARYMYWTMFSRISCAS